MANKYLTLLQKISDNLNIQNARKEIMDMGELASYLGMSKSYCYQLTSQNVIPYYQPIGKKIFFKRSEIDQWVFSKRISTKDEVFQDYESRKMSKNYSANKKTKKNVR